MISCSSSRSDDRYPCTGNCLAYTVVYRCKNCASIVNDDKWNYNCDYQSEGDSDSEFSEL